MRTSRRPRLCRVITGQAPDGPSRGRSGARTRVVFSCPPRAERRCVRSRAQWTSATATRPPTSSRRSTWRRPQQPPSAGPPPRTRQPPRPPRTRQPPRPRRRRGCHVRERRLPQCEFTRHRLRQHRLRQSRLQQCKLQQRRLRQSGLQQCRLRRRRNRRSARLAWDHSVYVRRRSGIQERRPQGRSAR